MNLSVEHLCFLREEVARLELSVPPGFWSISINDLPRIYNGVGPDRWPAEVRSTITDALLWTEPAVLVHDVGFLLKSRSFDLENKALLQNCYAVAWDSTGWAHFWLYLIRRGESKMLYKACDDFARAAWDA